MKKKSCSQNLSICYKTQKWSIMVSTKPRITLFS